MFLNTIKIKHGVTCLAAACIMMMSASSFAEKADGSIVPKDNMLVLGQELSPKHLKKSVTLKEVIELGLKTNPEYGIVANDRLAVDQELVQARALYLPSVDLRADTGGESTDTPSINDNDLFRNQVSLTLTQLLFDGYGTTSEIKRQKARVRSAAHRAYETAEFIALDITEAFLDVLRQRFLLKISEANVQNHIAIKRKIELGEVAGKSTIGDMSQASARLSLALANMEAIKESLAEAEDSYFRHVGNLPPAELVLPEFLVTSSGGDVDDIIHKAMLESPTLGVFDADLLVAKAEYEGSGSTLYPQFDIELAGSKGDNLSGVEGNETRASALLVMRWNLFRGGGDIARKKEFRARRSVAHDRRFTATRILEQEIRDTWAARNSAVRRAMHFYNQSKANVKVVQVYKDQFSMYKGRTLLDVLDVQNELFVARSNFANAFYADKFSRFRLLALQGALLKTINITPTEESFVGKN